MADDNKDLLELLDKLKKMQPAKDEQAKGDQEGDSLEDLLPSKPAVGKSADKRDDKGATLKKSVRRTVLDNEIYSKILDLEKEIRDKEDEINFDLTKIEELIEALGKREEELAANEEIIAQKDDELSKQLEDMKKIRAELQKVLR